MKLNLLIAIAITGAVSSPTPGNVTDGNDAYPPTSCYNCYEMVIDCTRVQQQQPPASPRL